jgi:(R,R)-butanediol dehydrogenase/meso-butanediol dehydrogenase/diacetyl reductase
VALLAAREGHEIALLDRNDRRAALVAGVTGGSVVTMEAMAQAGFRFAIDTTGNDQVIMALVEAIGGCGTLALVGIGRPGPVIDPVKLLEREITLVGCHAFGAELTEAVVLLPELGPRLDAFIAERIPLAAVPDAYARHLAGTVDGLKTIILCGEG